MSRSVFELLTIIEAYERYGALAKEMQQERHKYYYTELQKIILEVIKELCNQKWMLPSQQEKILQNPITFYESACKCLKTEENCSLNVRKIINITGNANSIIKHLEKEDGRLTCRDLKLEYRTPEAILFNKIMCKKVFPYKQEMEETMGVNFFSVLKNHRKFSFPYTAYNWEKILKELINEKKISEEQYEAYLRNLEYMCNYYWDKKDNADEKLVLVLKARYNIAMKG